MAKVAVYRWDELPADAPMPLLWRRRVVGERAMLSQVLLEAGCDVPMHAHENEQMTVVLRGQLEFHIGGGEREEIFVARAGDVVHLPGNLPHRARALEETLVLDVFSPVSEGTGIDRR
jgi:quercetin dioxygenase-like cupin family protein